MRTASNPRLRFHVGRPFPLRPATVQGETAFDRRLGALEDVAGTPALDAIQAGLGAYLEGVGFTAKHPLLYVNESNDPYVYVQFDISHDGLGFLDTTFVYSPGVASLLTEIFQAYGVYGASETESSYTSQTTMNGWPVHAASVALTTCWREGELDWYEEYSKVQGARPAKSWRQRMRIRRAARQRRRRGPNFHHPAFDALWEDDPRRFWRPPFCNLPLNWTLASPKDELPENFNWRVDTSCKTAAIEASAAIWRRYVEPRLIHASRDRGRDRYFKSRLSGADVGGDGVLGDEWEMYDVMFWSAKGQFVGKHYYESGEYNAFIRDHSAALYDDFNSLHWGLSRVAEAWAQRDAPHRARLDSAAQRELVALALEQEEIAHAAIVYKQQRAILAYRLGVKPESGWRTRLAERYFFVDNEPDQIVRRALFGSGR